MFAGALLCVIPVLAHHSVAADYDVSRTIRISGTISNVTFANPHVTFSLDVKSPDGSMVRWNVEFASPNVLLRAGVTKDLLAQGSTAVMDAYPAKDGSPKASGHAMRFPDGYEFVLPAPGQSMWCGPNCTKVRTATVK